MAPSKAPAPAPAAARPAVGTASADVKKLYAAQNPVRRRVEPVIPLPYIRRPKPPTATSQLPASPSPLRNNNETVPPAPEEQIIDQPQPQPQPVQVAAVTNGHKLANEAPISPQKSDQDDTGVTTLEADDPPPTELREPAVTGLQLQGTPTQSQNTAEATPPGMSRCQALQVQTLSDQHFKTQQPPASTPLLLSHLHRSRPLPPCDLPSTPPAIANFEVRPPTLSACQPILFINRGHTNSTPATVASSSAAFTGQTHPRLPLTLAGLTHLHLCTCRMIRSPSRPSTPSAVP